MPDTVSLQRKMPVIQHLIVVAVTTGKVLDAAELAAVHGRAWEDVDH